jgi:hypothetical protein
MRVPILNLLLLIVILVLVVLVFMRLPMSSEETYFSNTQTCKDYPKELCCGKRMSSNGHKCAWDGKECKAEQNWPAGTFPKWPTSCN